MNKKVQVFTRQLMQFSLKNPDYPISSIRVRFTINAQRGSYHLPASYKIDPKHWDHEQGRALLDSKRNTALNFSNVERLCCSTASTSVS